MIRRRPHALLAMTLALPMASAPLTAAFADGPVYAPVPRAPPARPAPPPPAPIEQPMSVLRVDLSSGGAQSLTLPRGKSAIVELPVDVRDLMVTDPKVAEAIVRSPRRISVLGVGNGQTDAVFFDAAGRRILSLDIRVDQDIAAIAETIQRVLPGSQVRVEPANGGVILTGLVLNAADADKAQRVAQQFMGKDIVALNMLTIAGKDQVTLKVRIVEVQRNVIKQLGMSSDILVNDGFKSYGLGRSNTFAVNGDLLGGGGACYNRNNTRTTNTTNNNNTSNQNTTTSGSNNSTSNGTSNSTTNGTTNSSTNGTTNSTTSGTTNTTANGVDWDGNPFPTTVNVVDVNGNLVTVSGTSLATAARNAATNNGTANAINSATNNGVTGATSNSVTSAVNGSTNNGTSNALTNLISSAASTAYSTVTGSNASACLQAFERVGLVRTLAEPNLTVVSGEAGKFLVGGEFPVPTGQDSDGKVTLEFKPYGVGLGYTPVVMSGGRISLKLSTEVSELSSLGAFSMAAGNTTLSVPGLTVRRAETTVELPSGGSLMIAGLLQQTSKQNVDSLPGMTALPVLGSLFRSRDYLNGETELVIMITPYIVDPTRPDRLQTPADGLQIASDPETVLLGRLNKVVRAPEGALAGRRYQGPIGYVIE